MGDGNGDTPFERAAVRSAARPDTPRDEFVRRAAAAVGLAVLAVGLVAAFVRASDIFFLFFAAVLLAILLRAAVDAVARATRLGPGWAYGLVLGSLACLAAAGVYAAGSTAVAQFNQLADSLPMSADQARRQVRQYRWGDELLKRAPPVEDLVVGSKGNAASTATRFFSTTLGVLGNLVVLGVLTLYLAATPHKYVGGLVRLVPPAGRGRAREVLTAVGSQLRWWLVGRLVAMAAVGLVVGVGRTVVGVPQALVLALVAGLLTAVPFVGPIAGAVPGVVVAVSQGPATAGWAAAVYVLAQAVENYLVTPLVQERMVSLPPVLTIGAITLAGALFGLMGLVVATPLAVAAKVAVKMLYVEDVLGDELPVRGEPEPA